MLLRGHLAVRGSLQASVHLGTDWDVFQTEPLILLVASVVVGLRPSRSGAGQLRVRAPPQLANKH